MKFNRTRAARAITSLVVDLGHRVHDRLFAYQAGAGLIACAVDPIIVTHLERIGAESAARLDGFAAQLLDVQQRLVRGGGGSGGGQPESLGAQVEAAFAESDARDLLKKTGRLTLEIAAAITTTNTGGAHGTRDVPTAPSGSGTSLVDLLTPGPLNGLTVLHYARRTGTTGGAAAQDAELATKATAEPVFAPQSQNTITVAGLATLSEQSLNAAGGLERAVNSHLAKSVRDACDAILIAGTTATGWPFAGFQALAAAFVSAVGYKSVIDAVLSAATRMRLQGFAPSIAVLSEADFLGVQLGKGTDGHYLSAASLLRDAGLTLALSASVTPGTSLLIDPQFVGFLSSGSTRITLGYVNDGFAKNQITMRAETEIAPFFADYQAALSVTPSAT